MTNEELLNASSRVALAGFLHDIGKFAERAKLPIDQKEIDINQQMYCPQRENNGRNVNNQLNIARHAFNPYNQTPYFAGSSIKGAIRTALLNNNNNERLPFPVNEKTPSNKLQQHLFGHTSIQSDPLRLLKISDATYSHVDNLHSAEIRFAVNRKNKPSKFEAKGLNQLLECLIQRKKKCKGKQE